MTHAKRNGVALLAVVLLALAWIQARHEVATSGVTLERFRLPDAYATPVIRFVPSAGERSGVLAVLVHGHQCNKAMMAQLARHLAAGGIDAYAIDLPGHGESREAFSADKARAATSSAVAEIIARAGASATELVLIGHSFGAVALGPTALQANPLATVFLGPGKPEGLSRERPRNVLIVTAEHDNDDIKQDAQAIVDDVTARAGHPPGNPVGDFRQQDARAWEVIPDAAHMSLLVDSRVHRRVAQWIEGAAGRSISVQIPHTSGPAARAAVLALALVLALAVLMAGMIRVPAEIQAREPPCHWALPAVAAIAGLYFSALAVNGFVPLRFLRLEEGEVLASHLAVSGILGLAFFAALGGKILCRWALLDAGVAAAVFLLLYGATLFAIDGEFYNTRIGAGDLRRLATLGTIVIAAVPFCLLQEALVRRYATTRRCGIRGFSADCGAFLALALLFCASLYWVEGRLARFNAELMGVLLYCAVVGAILHARFKHTCAGIVFSSLVGGWVIAVGFFYY